jgi:hypothetical protein
MQDGISGSLLILPFCCGMNLVGNIICNLSFISCSAADGYGCTLCVQDAERPIECYTAEQWNEMSLTENPSCHPAFISGSWF